MRKHLQLAATMALLFGAAAWAEDKKPDVDKDKLVGTWEAVKGSETLPLGSTIDFTKDGKLKLTIKEGDKSQVFEGTYKVDGAAFKATLKDGDKEHTETLKVYRLTDKELVIIDEAGKKDVLSKKK
jgi:uncharacterized protein (TIGR03066 family)